LWCSLTWDLGAREGPAPKQKRQKFNQDVYVFQKIIFEKPVYKLFYICLLLKKLVNKKYFLVNKKHFPVKKNLAWFSGKCFSFISDGKHSSKVVKKLKMSYYLLIISNLVLKFLIAVYIFCFEYLFFNFIH